MTTASTPCSTCGHQASMLRHAKARASSPKAEQAGMLRLVGLRAERAHIFNLARNSQISDETSRKLVREIDLMESPYR